MFEKSYEIRLKLKEIAHLFTNPVLDPFSEYYKPYTSTSGIEYIYYELCGHSRRKKIVTTIILPEDQVTPKIEEETRKAVQRYSNNKIYEVSQDISALWYKGIRMMIFAFIAFFLSISVYIYLSEGFSSLNIFYKALTEGINILGWVFLWFPLELLIFKMWGHLFERNVYKKMAKMEIRIKSINEYK